MQLPLSVKNQFYRAYHGAVRRFGRHPADVLLWPPINSQEQLDDLLPRLRFHFASRRHSPIRVVISRADDQLVPSGEVPSYLHSYEDRFEGEVTWLPASHAPTSLVEAARQYRGVLLTQPAADIPGGQWLQYLPNVVPFHPEDVEMETYWVAKLMYRRRGREMRKARNRFLDFAARLPKRRKAYLLCTGPSLSRYAEFDFSDGYVIGCNSVVSNEGLLEHARPQFIVACDPIFHFGPSVYAEKFRENLADAARRHPFLFLTLAVYHHLLETHFSLPRKRICEIPVSLQKPMRRLDRHWVLPQTANVMTMLMMPIAHTLAKEIHIIGADGREPGETYFWKHDPASQISDKMQAIQQCHPAFFKKRDYDNYYEKHCRIVERQVQQVEKRGGRVYTMTPSYIPALQSRLAPGAQ